jgi:hypothetical protein
LRETGARDMCRDIFQRQIKPALDEVIDNSFRVAAE